jgi:hypothetical protein
MAVSKRTRFEVLKRDNHTCRYCGATAPDAILTVDHVTPVALGGTDDPSNLVAACRDCNYGKSSTAPDAAVVADVAELDVKWADAMRRAAEIRQVALEERDAYISTFEREWTSVRLMPYAADPESVGRLFDAGLPAFEMSDVIRIATGARNVEDRFAYFMGICWKRVAALQDVAKQLLEADGVDA